MSFQGDFTHLIFKEEVTPGTAVTLSASDFNIPVLQASIEYEPNIEIDDENAKEATGYHYETLSNTGARWATITVSTYWRYSGTAATPPNVAKLAKACGATETVYGAVGVGWEDGITGDISTVTIGMRERERGSATQHIVKLFAGCMGNMTLSCEGIGKPLIANFKFMGKIVSNTDSSSAIALGTLNTANPLKYLGSSTTIMGSSLLVSSFAFDMGNDIQPKYKDSESTGIINFEIAKRSPRFSCNPLMERVATFDAYSKTVDMTTGSNEIAFNTNELIITLPRTQILTATEAEREGLKNWDFNLKCLNDDGTNANIADTSCWQLLQGAYS